MVVYSDETLREIERSSGFEKAFLDMLVRLDAKYLSPDMADDGFGETAALLDIDPHAEFEEFRSSKIDVGGVDILFLRVSQALSGARRNRKVEDLLADVRRLGLGMGNNAQRAAQELDNLPPELRKQLEDSRRILDDLEAHIRAPGFSQPRSLDEVDRKRAGGPLHLNNIQPPKVVEQIWERLPPEVKEKTSIGVYFGTERNGGPPMSLADKARWAFTVLDIVGYYRDPKQKTDRKIESLYGDMGHVTFASYCHAFATLDDRLAKKAAAAYEFVWCPTKVIPGPWAAERARKEKLGH